MRSCKQKAKGKPPIFLRWVLQVAQRIFEEAVKKENPSVLVKNEKGEIVESGVITLLQVKGAMHLQYTCNKQKCLIEQVCVLIRLRMLEETGRQESVARRPPRLVEACLLRRERAVRLGLVLPNLHGVHVRCLCAAPPGSLISRCYDAQLFAAAGTRAETKRL